MGQKLNEQIAQAEAQLISRANVIAETFTAVGQHIGQSTNEAAKHHRHQHARAQHHARRAFGRDHRRSSTRRRGRWSSASPRAARTGEEHRRRHQRATEKLRSENAALVNALASRTAETLSAVEGARIDLAEGVADLIGRWRRPARSSMS